MGGSATAVTTRGVSPEVPWWKRGWARLTAFVVSVGTLASAVSAIVALWPDPDLVDSAQITSIEVFSPVSLTEYEGRAAMISPLSAERQPSTGPIMPVAVVVAAPAASGAVVASPSLAQQPSVLTQPTPTNPQPTPDTPATTESAPPESPSTSPSAPATESPTGSPAHSPTGTTTASPTSSPTGTTTGSPTISPTAPLPGLMTRVEPGIVREVIPRVRELRPRYLLRTEVTDPEAPRPPMRAAIEAAVLNAEGEPVDPALAARRVAEFLGDTRTVVNRAGKKVPQGAVLDANVTLEGLRDQVVLVSWSIWRQGGDEALYGRWLQQIRAFELTATSARDTAAFQLWVPLPERPGEYVVRLQLATSDAVLVTGASDPFG